jgi:hypothetical protein
MNLTPDIPISSLRASLNGNVIVPDGHMPGWSISTNPAPGATRRRT